MAERAVCVSGVCGGVFGSERVVVCMCVNFLCVSVCRCGVNVFVMYMRRVLGAIKILVDP